MAKVQAGRGAESERVAVRAYTSPTLVLLAMDWADGAKYQDFLGFAILRSPGFHPGEKDGFLLNKIGFAPPGPHSQSLPSSVSPIQKFLWWDSAITDADRGKTFTYTVTPVRGTGPQDLKLHDEASSGPTKVDVPTVERNDIGTWFNRAVVSSQSFSRKFADPPKELDAVMDWLANGLEDAFVQILKGAKHVNGAIYHLTDNEWVMPDLKSFKGDLSLVYEDRTNDTTCLPAINALEKAKKGKFTGEKRSKTNIMHNKFLVDEDNERVLVGSANYTPEGLTSQANLLHLFKSRDLSNLFSERQKLLAQDPSVPDTAKGAGWSDVVSVGKAKIRVFFSPEPKKQRVSLDTVIAAVNKAKESVIFCMFDPTDPELISSLLAVGDKKKLLYGMLNSISNPNKKKKKDDLSDTGEAPRKPTAATQIKVTLYNRSQKDKKVLAYSYFRPGATPAGFLPELSAVDMSSKSTLPPPKKGTKKGGPPAVHIHHKFIVIDAETETPVIYTGSNNLSENSTHHNDENLLEIKGSPDLAQTYFAEFMRLYEHYRARALWNMSHPSTKGRLKTTATADSKLGNTFTLKTTRDQWVRRAYKAGTPEYLARTLLAEKG
jgi:phosphatidylserine/phosphatidylglycerophosphate/cardiolipin synthase-like enzyme